MFVFAFFALLRLLRPPISIKTSTYIQYIIQAEEWQVPDAATGTGCAGSTIGNHGPRSSQGVRPDGFMEKHLRLPRGWELV